MKAVVAFFPSIDALADFVLSHNIQAEVNVREIAATAKMEDELIVLAETKYQAYVVPAKKQNNKA